MRCFATDCDLCTSFNAVNDSLTQTVQNNLISQATEQLDTLQRELASSKHELVTLSQLSTMQNVILGDPASNLQQDIDTFAKRAPLYAEIVVVDYSGTAVAGTLQEYSNYNFNGTWEFEAPKLGINFDGRVVKSYRLDRNIATQSVPLYSTENPDRFIGALIGSIDWDYLQQEMGRNSVFGDEQSQQRQVFLESLESSSILYGTAGVTPPVELLSTMATSSDVQRVVHEGQDFILVSIHSHPVEEFRDPQWRLHVFLDSDVAYASVHELKNHFLLAGGVVSILVIALGLVFARSIVTPVKSLVKGAERLSTGDYEYELPENNARDEISQLTHSFNSMRIAVRRNEQELVTKTEAAEQAARLKGEFLANMSHEVRTPINGVLGMTELLLNTSLDTTQSRYANTIARSGQALLAVINDILDFSKIEAGKLNLTISNFDLRDLVEDVVEMVAESAHRKGLDLTLQMPPDNHTAFKGDSARLRQVLLNLLSNAVKFTAVGEVRLQVSCATISDSIARVHFKVVDTGIGIDADNQDKIFESFVQADGSTTREFGGTGLGLSISSKLVGLMGGKLGVESISGQGSTFWIEINLEPLPSSAGLAWREPNSLAGNRILVVDDSPTMRDVLAIQINYWGAEPVEAASTKEALIALENVSGTRNVFDAVILDMNMPAMSGIGLIESIHGKQLATSTRLILLGTTGDIPDRQACSSKGIQFVLGKPARQSDLYRCLTEAIYSDDAAVPENKQIARKIESSPLRGRVLLAEDNPVNQDMMLEMLRLIGVTAELACNGQDVLAALEENQFDLVLMDCQMPVLDGFAATKMIRNNECSRNDGKRMPIIALTANAMQGDRERCLASGMDDYLSKPVSSIQLKDSIGKWLQNAKANHPATLALKSVGPSTPEICTKVQSIVDESVFSELLLMCASAPDGFYSQLVQKFGDSSSEDLNRIRDALNQKDTQQMGTSAHRLKSGSASWGARNLTQLLQALEKASGNSEIEHARFLLKQVEREHSNLIHFLHTQKSKAA